MSTAELRDQVLKRIVTIDKDYLLEDILNIIELETSEEIIQLSNSEKTDIKIGLEQIENGETYSNEDVERELKEWLDNE